VNGSVLSIMDNFSKYLAMSHYLNCLNMTIFPLFVYQDQWCECYYYNTRHTLLISLRKSRCFCSICVFAIHIICFLFCWYLLVCFDLLFVLFMDNFSKYLAMSHYLNCLNMTIFPLFVYQDGDAWV
jgi:hypothetical protein